MKNLSWALAVLNQYGIKLFFGQLPRLVYGNDAGFTNNFKARRALKNIQRKFPHFTTGPDTRAESLKKEGYCLVDPHYDPTLMNQIVTKYETLIHDDAHSQYIGPRIREAIRGIAEPIQCIPEIRFLLTDEIQKIIQSYYKAHFKVMHVRCWRNYHVNAAGSQRDVYSNLWHNDPHPVTLLRYFVYLTDNVNVNSGAFRLHPIPSTKKIIRSGYFRRRAIIGPAAKMIEDPKRLIVFEGNQGSGCLANPQLCLHRAGVPHPGGHRDMVQFTLAPSEEPLSQNWHLELGADPEGLNY